MGVFNSATYPVHLPRFCSIAPAGRRGQAHARSDRIFVMISNRRPVSPAADRQARRSRDEKAATVPNNLARARTKRFIGDGTEAGQWT